MVQRTRLWTLAMATAGLASLPIIGTAQSYPPSSSTQTQTSSAQSTTSTSQQNTPQFHLDEAKKDLDSIATSSLSGDAASQISQLKTHFDMLYNDFKKSGGASASGYGLGNSASGSAAASGGTSSTGGQVGTTGTQQGAGVTPPSGTSSSMSADWKSHYTQINDILDRLNIPASSLRGASSAYGASGSGSVSGTAGTAGSTSGTTGTTGTTTSGTTTSGTTTSGTTTSGSTSAGQAGSTYGSSKSSVPTLSADVRAKLADFRMHLDQFYSLASGQASADIGTSGTVGTSGMTSGTTGTTGTTGSGMTSSQSGSTYPPTGQTSSQASAAQTGTSGSTLGFASKYLDDIENIVNHALNESPSSSGRTSGQAASGTTTSGSTAAGTSGQTSTEQQTMTGSSKTSTSKGTARRSTRATKNGVYMTRAQLEQIKADVAALRQQLGEK